MPRFVTLLCALMAGGAGLMLYTKKHETMMLDESIRHTVQEIHRTDQKTSMLRAEWALLNQPDRLKGLDKKALPYLRPTDPEQFVSPHDLKKHLPSPPHS